MQATQATLAVWLRLDADDNLLSEYLSIDLPAAWDLRIGPRRPLGEIYAEAYERAPDAFWYGFIADDVVPETPEWDLKLREAAGLDAMAVPAGGHDPDGAPHFVLGGDLVREVGWLCLPGLDRIYIDTVWMLLAKAKGVFRRVPEVVLAHHHFSNGKALYDSVYKKRSKPEDRALYDNFVREQL